MVISTGGLAGNLTETQLRFTNTASQYASLGSRNRVRSKSER